MTETTFHIQKEPTPARWLKLLRFRFIIPAMIVLCGFCFPFGYRFYILSQVPQIDEPFDTKAFGTFNVPTIENSQNDYKLAITKLSHSSMPDSVELDKALEGDWSAASPKTRQWVKENQEALEIWRKGTTKQHHIYCQPKDFTLATLLDTIQELRTFAQLASLVGKQQEAEGHFQEALEWYQAIFRCSRQLGERGCLIERLVGMVIYRMAVDSIVHWSEKPEVTSEQIKQASTDVINFYSRTAPLSVAVKSEYYITKHFLQSPHSHHGYIPTSSNPRRFQFNKIFRVEPELSRLILPHHTKNLLAQIDLPLYQRKEFTLGGISLFDNSGLHSASDYSLTVKELQRVILQSDFLRDFTTVYSSVLTAVDRERTRQGILVVLLAVQQYQRDYGKFPLDSATLIEEKYIDQMPLDGLQTTQLDIQYRHNKKWTAVYSLGEDGINDGGASANFASGESGDFGVIIVVNKKTSK